MHKFHELIVLWYIQRPRNRITRLPGRMIELRLGHERIPQIHHWYVKFLPNSNSCIRIALGAGSFTGKRRQSIALVEDP